MNTIVRGPIAGGECTKCPFAIDGAPNNPVPGIGPEDPDWIIIGESPGQNEVRAKAPMAGPSGAIVNRMLGEIGVDRSRLWVTNACLCMAPKGAPDEDRDTAAAACRPRLNAELSRTPGKPLLVLGGPATRAVCPSTLVKITQLAGTYHEVDLDGTGPRAMIPSLHPAFLLHGGGDSKGAGGGHVAAMGYVNLKFDALKVKNLALGNPIKLEINIDTEVKNETRANKMVQDLAVECMNDEYLGVDLETYVDDEERNNALQMHIARIRFLGLSSKNRAISVLWEHLTSQTINTFRALLANKRVVKGMHNLTYEHGVLQNPHYRFRIEGEVEDTLLGHHAAFPGLRHALQGVACQFRGIPPWKSEFRDGKREDVADPAEESIYNATDIFATTKTIGPLHVWIKKTKTERVYEIDRKMAKCAARMHLDGIQIDPEVNAELDRRYTLATTAAREQILDTFESMRDKVLDRLAFERAKVKRKKDPEDFVERITKRLAEEHKAIAKNKWEFSPGKDMHMIALLKAKNVPLTKMTDTGRTSTAASVLEDLAHVPEVAALLRYRSNEKLAGFNRRMFQWTVNSQKKNVPPFVQDDGRIHPIWSVNKLSGRWGSEDPATQNVSEGDEQNKDVTRRLANLRRQYVAPNGRVIIAFDFEQLEARTMALQSDDPFLTKVFAEKKDIHAEFAVMLFPEFAQLVPKSPGWVKQRNITKRLEYGGVYGGSDDTVWKSIVVDFPEVSLKMVSSAIKKMKIAVAGVLRWQQRLFEACSQPPYELRSYILGRRRVFPMGDPSPTDVNNNPNQFTGSDIMNVGMANMIPRLEKYRGRVVPIAQIHDAAYFECDDNDRRIQQVGRDVTEAFTQYYTSPSGVEIDFPIELKYGFCMADANPALDAEFGIGRPGLGKLKLAS